MPHLLVALACGAGLACSGDGNNAASASRPEVHALSEEVYLTEVVWTADQGMGAYNNFGKNYHSMSVWRDGYTFIVYVDRDFRPRITRVSDDGQDVTTAVVADYSVLADGHHALAIGIDADGYLHVSGDMHNYPVANTGHLPAEYQSGKCMYWRSDEPMNIDSFTWLGAGDDGVMPYGDSFSYMSFTNDRAGNLYYYARTRTNWGDFSNKQVFTVSRYDVDTQTWTEIGATADSARRSAVTLLGYDNEGNSGSYTRIHGWVAFDRLNRMFMAANVIEGPNNFAAPPHYATHALLLASDDLGDSATWADGTPVVMPGVAQSGSPQQADIPYYNPDTSLATFTSVAADIDLRPHVLLKTHSNGMALLGWRDTQGWVNYGDLDGAIPSGRTRINTDPGGVMTVLEGSTLVRFYDPEGEVRRESLPVGGIENVDRSYLDATGNLQAMASSGGTISLVRVEIEHP